METNKKYRYKLSSNKEDRGLHFNDNEDNSRIVESSLTIDEIKDIVGNDINVESDDSREGLHFG